MVTVKIECEDLLTRRRITLAIQTAIRNLGYEVYYNPKENTEDEVHMNIEIEK